MAMDTGTDSPTDSGDNGQWLTYGELARLRRIDRHSAVKLVTRHGWRRQKDNRGVLRILVPPEWAVSRDKGTDHATDTGTDMGTDTASAIAALSEALAASDARATRLDLLIEVERGKFLAAEIKAAAATERAEAATERAEIAEGRQRWAEDRVEGLRDLLTDAERRVATAEDARKAVLAQAEALERAEFERAGRSVWRRLADAWRGR